MAGLVGALTLPAIYGAFHHHKYLKKRERYRTLALRAADDDILGDFRDG
jgi:hypothetical protein